MKNLSIIILSICFGIIADRTFLYWGNTPSTLEDCASLPTNKGVETCRNAYYQRIRKENRPIRIRNPEVLAGIKLESSSVELIKGTWHFSGMLRNENPQTVKNINYTIQFFAKGDSPENSMPLATVSQIIDGPVHYNKNYRFDEDLSFMNPDMRKASKSSQPRLAFTSLEYE